MKKILFIHLLFFIACSAAQARIYKWTDENGAIIYGERPPRSVPRNNIKRIEVDTVSEEVSEAAQEQYQGNSKAFDERRLESNEAQQKAAKEAKIKREVSAFCTQIRQRITMLQSKSKVAQIGPDGKKQLYNQQKRASEIQRARSKMQKHCS